MSVPVKNAPSVHELHEIYPSEISMFSHRSMQGRSSFVHNLFAPTFIDALVLESVTFPWGNMSDQLLATWRWMPPVEDALFMSPNECRRGGWPVLSPYAPLHHRIPSDARCTWCRESHLAPPPLRSL